MTRKKANKKKNKRRSSSNRASKSTKWALRLSPDLLYILLFVVVVISMHPALILQGKRYGVDDNVVKTITANNVEQDDGTTAYWDPNSWGGIPNVFHLPKTVLSPDFYLRALSEQTNLALVYLLFGAIGMFFLLRYLRFSRPTAVIGVLIFIMVPYYKSLLIVGHIDKFPSIMHIPWIAWFTLRVRDRQSLSNMLLLALILGLQLRANHYQIVFYTGFVVISLLIPSLIQAARQRVFSAIFRKIFTVAGAYLCAVLLAAQPLLATFQLSDNTLRTNTPIDIQRSDQSGAAATRGVDKSFVKTWSWASRDILSLILPRAVGGLTIENYNGQVPGYIDGVVPGYWGSVPFSRTYYYMGALAIFFCIIGIAAHKDQRIVRSLTGLCLLTVLWALGVNAGYFYDLCYNYLPFFKNFRTPITSLAILYFAIAILATFGVNFLLGDSPVSRKIRISNWAGGVMIVIGIALAAAYLLLPFSRVGDGIEPEIQAQVVDIRRSYYFRDLLKYLALVLLTFVILRAYLAGRVKHNLFIGCLSILIIMDLFWVLSQYRTIPISKTQFNSENFPVSPAVKHLQQDNDVFRIFSYTQREQSLSYYFQSLGRSTDLQMSNKMYDLAANSLFKNIDGLINVNWNTLDFMNIKYVLTERTLDHPKLNLEVSDPVRQLNVYRYKFSRPRGFFVNRYMVVPDDKERINLINSSSLDFTQVALLEEEPSIALGSSPSWKAELRNYTSESMQFDIETNQAGLFVISELFYPDLQEIHLDGVKVTEVYRTNHTVQSVVIPSGTHTLELRYSAGFFIRGAMISRVSFLLLYLLLLMPVAPLLLKRFRKRISMPEN